MLVPDSQELGAFTSLARLSCGNCGIASLEGFPSLPSLQKLKMPDNRLAGGLEHLSGCSQLQHLDLSGNKLASLDALEPLRQLQHLHSLDLYGNAVEATPSCRERVFGMLPSLKYLNGEDAEGQGACAGEGRGLVHGMFHDLAVIYGAHPSQPPAEADDGESGDEEEEDDDDDDGEEVRFCLCFAWRRIVWRGVVTVGEPCFVAFYDEEGALGRLLGGKH